MGHNQPLKTCLLLQQHLRALPSFGRWDAWPLQMGQEADEETQNWLDNMMSNRVVSRAGSGTRPDQALSSGGLKTPKPKPGDRAMRKTLILRAGTSDAVRTCVAHTHMSILL